MSGKLSRSWQLAKSSARVLAQEPSLLVLPFFALLGAAGVAAAIYFGIVEPLGLHDVFRDQNDSDAENEALKIEHLLIVFLFYVGTSFVMGFFNVALVSAALSRFRGEQGGLASGLACATAKAPVILGYSAIVGLLGVIRKVLRDRGGIAGSIGASLVGLAFGIATFLVIPVIASEKVNPISAIRRSASLLKSTWGENIIGSAAIGLVFVLSIFLAVAIGFGGVVVTFFATASEPFDGPHPIIVSIAVLTGLAILAIIVVWGAIGSIYRAAVYAYAVDGSVPEAFARPQIEGAFRKKGEPAAAAV